MISACVCLLTGKCKKLHPWAARYYTGLLINLTPKGIVFSFLFQAVASMVMCHLIHQMLCCLPVVCHYVASVVAATYGMYKPLPSSHCLPTWPLQVNSNQWAFLLIVHFVKTSAWLPAAIQRTPSVASAVHTMLLARRSSETPPDQSLDK